MNKELETLKTNYHELSKKFLQALQNNGSSGELEILKQQMKDILLKMKAVSFPGAAHEDAS